MTLAKGRQQQFLVRDHRLSWISPPMTGHPGEAVGIVRGDERRPAVAYQLLAPIFGAAPSGSTLLN
jgi:hypothetical protein